MNEMPTFRPYQDRWASEQSRLALIVKATQIGVSSSTAAWAIIERCLPRPGHLVIILSRSERQSLELARKCKAMVDAYDGIVADFAENRQFQMTEQKQHEIEFANGSRIIALAANPDTARGYTGDMVLDEFAFHQDADEIFQAAYGRMTNPGYQMRVISTANGAHGKFFELAKRMGLDGGFRPPRQPVKAEWSAHWCDVHLAVEEGFPVSIPQLRAGCDEETWLQEYCCNFLAGGSQWIPWELYEANVEPDLVVDEDPQGSGLYAGWDVARSRDLSVVWFSQLVGDVMVTRGVLVMAKTPTPDQTACVSGIMPRVHRLCVDKTGMGSGPDGTRFRDHAPRASPMRGQVRDGPADLRDDGPTVPREGRGHHLHAADEGDDGDQGQAASGRNPMQTAQRSGNLAKLPQCQEDHYGSRTSSIRRSARLRSR